MTTAAQMFKQACRLHLDHAIHRYLMSNTSGRMDGHEKAQRHIELCTFYVAAVRGVDDLDLVRRGHEDDYQAVHDATQALTDHLDEVIGFPLEGRPDYRALVPLFFEKFHTLAMQALGAAAPMVEPECKICGGDRYIAEPRTPGIDCPACIRPE
jgi:hypothetical protein